MACRLLSQYQTVFSIWEHMNARLLTLIYRGTYDWPTPYPARNILIYRHSVHDLLSKPQKLSWVFFFFVTFLIKNFYKNSNKLFINMPFYCINMLFIPFFTIVSIYTAINDKVPTLAHKKISKCVGFFLHNYKRALTASSWDITTVNNDGKYALVHRRWHR